MEPIIDGRLSSSADLPVQLWFVGPGESSRITQSQRETLDHGERARAAAFVRPSDRGSYETAHVALRSVLSEVLQRPPGAISFARDLCPSCGGPHGRPVVRDASGWHFSLSHSSGHALIAVARRLVGVDIEVWDATRSYETLRHCLHEDELEAFDNLPGDSRTRAFIACWVRKEAYLKGTGVGIVTDLGKVRVGLGSREHQVLHPDGWTVTDVPSPPDTEAAVALLGQHGDSPAPRVKRWLAD